MTIAIINRYIQTFSDAFVAMSVDVPMPEIERLAMMVHSAMENKRRVYHSSKHVFDMCEDMNPRQVLAALFHDVVYYQLDGGFPQQAAALLMPIVTIENGALILNPIRTDDTLLQHCAALFKFTPGQVLPLFGGMNEFLSAVVACRVLQPYLQAHDMIAIMACIEATVPFRGKDAEGRDPARALADRVREQSRHLPGMEADEPLAQHVASAMSDAVIIANRDVAGFAEPNPGKFLSATWQLIEESNAPLAAVGVYTLQDYRGALFRMNNFLCGLNPESIFHHYANLPGDADFAVMTAAAKRNLAFACAYLGAKITAIGIIEALAMTTGGNCPVSMFLGDIRSPYGKPDRAEDFLPEFDASPDIDPELLGVLERGRAQESNNDLTSSPLTAFMYRSLGRQGIATALEQAMRMFANELAPLDFLRGLDKRMVTAVIDACMKIAISRREALGVLKAALA